MEYLNSIFLRRVGTMTNRRVHKTSFNKSVKNHVSVLSDSNSLLFCHIINSLERFILFKGSPATVNISESLPKEPMVLPFHSPKQTDKSNQGYILSKTTFNVLKQPLVGLKILQQDYLRMQVCPATEIDR